MHSDPSSRRRCFRRASLSVTQRWALTGPRFSGFCVSLGRLSSEEVARFIFIPRLWCFPEWRNAVGISSSGIAVWRAPLWARRVDIKWSNKLLFFYFSEDKLFSSFDSSWYLVPSTHLAAGVMRSLFTLILILQSLWQILYAVGCI